jgi:NAD(P)H dehydrogenase (quinone)
MSASYVLVLYYSRHGATRALAESIANGIEQSGTSARIRTVPDAPTSDLADSEGTLYVTQDDLRECSGLALGSPTRFGHMASALSAFLETTTSEWLSGSLIDKPATLFTSSSSQHGGQESTLLSMALPLIHQGMLLVGVPYNVAELHSTTGGGTPYGASQVSHSSHRLSPDEQKIAVAQGKRLGTLAQRLSYR